MHNNEPKKKEKHRKSYQKMKKKRFLQYGNRYGVGTLISLPSSRLLLLILGQCLLVVLLTYYTGDER